MSKTNPHLFWLITFFFFRAYSYCSDTTVSDSFFYKLYDSDIVEVSESIEKSSQPKPEKTGLNPQADRLEANKDFFSNLLSLNNQLEMYPTNSRGRESEESNILKMGVVYPFWNTTSFKLFITVSTLLILGIVISYIQEKAESDEHFE